MEILPVQKVTFSGSEEARDFKKLAQKLLNDLITETQLNQLNYLKRHIQVIPGFEITVEKNFNRQQVHVHLAPQSVEQAKAVFGLNEFFLVVQIEEITKVLDPSYGGGDSYTTYKVTVKGGVPPYMYAVNADPSLPDPTIPQFKNVQAFQESYLDGTVSLTAVICREIDTDPWGAVDAADSTSDAHVGVTVYDSNGRMLFAPFSGSDGSLGSWYRGKFYSYGRFSQYGPPATDNFALTATGKDATTGITWTGGFSDFSAEIGGVVWSTSNVQVAFLDNDPQKRKVTLVKTTGIYWAVLDMDLGTDLLEFVVSDSDGNALTIPWSEITGDKPAYQVPMLISKTNSGSTLVIHFKYGIPRFNWQLLGYVVGIDVSGTFPEDPGQLDDITVTFVKSSSAIEWCYVEGTGAGIRITDGTSVHNLDIPFVYGVFNPPRYANIVVTTNNRNTTTNNINIVITGGVAPFTLYRYFSNGTANSVTTVDSNRNWNFAYVYDGGSTYLQQLTIVDFLGYSVVLTYPAPNVSYSVPIQSIFFKGWNYPTSANPHKYGNQTANETYGGVSYPNEAIYTVIFRKDDGTIRRVMPNSFISGTSIYNESDSGTFVLDGTSTVVTRQAGERRIVFAAIMLSGTTSGGGAWNLHIDSDAGGTVADANAAISGLNLSENMLFSQASAMHYGPMYIGATSFNSYIIRIFEVTTPL